MSYEAKYTITLLLEAVLFGAAGVAAYGILLILRGDL